jgi:HEAT repeat protein/YHS domain-containing protein
MNCPVCGKPVDPLRAPAVGVRDGKVVSYCSREHAQEAETKPTVVAKPKPRASSEPAFRIPEADRKRSTPHAGIATPESTYDSGPVIEIVHEPASGVVTSAPDARDTRVSEPRIPRSQTSGAIQIADTGRVDDYISSDDDGEPRSRRGWIAVVILLVLGGGAFAAYELGYLDSVFKHDSQAATSHPVHETPAAVVVADAAPAPPTPEIAIARAREVLATMMTTSSPRIVRHAAAALARTADPAAIAALQAALAAETKDPAKTSVTTKIELLYDLARAGDKHAVEDLVKELYDQNRDHRIDAATRLRQLGDKRAPDALAQYLDYPQFHTGVAKQLAMAADPRGIKVFQAVVADPKASADDKAIAAIALGYAGQGTVTTELHQLLDDSHFNADAAAALVREHDPKARPTLVKQLGVSALRVQAARWLRQLDPAPDPSEFPALLAELATPQDSDVQVGAAETLLLLAGPVEWAKYE